MLCCRAPAIRHATRSRVLRRCETPGETAIEMYALLARAGAHRSTVVLATFQPEVEANPALAIRPCELSR